MNSILVVEGKNDANKLKSIYPKITILTTNGTEINKEIMNQIVEYSKSHEIILFLDPDGPGEIIRKKIVQQVPNSSHAFIEKKYAISKNKKKVGIEHASTEVIKKALDDKIVFNPSEEIIPNHVFFDLKLIGASDSKERRNKIALELKLGYTNGKTFMKRINDFNISVDKLIETNKKVNGD